MSLPSVACFRQMDIIDQLTALYEAILQLSSGSFSPDQILGLQAWYKDTGIVSEEGSVTSWDDSSPNGFSLTPTVTSPSLVAAGLNGINTVSFTSPDGVTGSALNKGHAIFTGSAATLFIVANKDSAWPASGWYTVRTDDPNEHPDALNDVQDAFCSTARKACGSQVVSINDNWRIISIRSQSGEYVIKVDGQLQFSTNSNTFDAGQDFVLGAGGYDGADFSRSFQGEIAEAIAYNTFLSDNQEEAVLNYLRSRFNL